jgi:2-keto-4-pentenoate hydratase/2-oxohepta-3-ene-1,7-dioic acid hydratase in catechol pathway
MKLVTYRSSVEAAARLGVIADDLVVDVAARLASAQGEDLPDTMLGLIDAGRPGLEALRDCLEQANGRFPAGTATALSNVKLLAPIPRPRKNIFGIGLNYVEHVAESARRWTPRRTCPSSR